jgi:hypothetical protein
MYGWMDGWYVLYIRGSLGIGIYTHLACTVIDLDSRQQTEIEHIAN